MAIQPVYVPDEVQELLQRQRKALERVAPQHRGRLLKLARESADKLVARLRTMAGDRFSAQETRVVLAQVRAVTQVLGAEHGQRIGAEIERIGRTAAGIGRGSLQQQIQAWQREFPVGTLGRTAPVEFAGALLDPGLLEYYRTSRERYGIEAVRKMRDVMAQGVLQGETLIQTADRMAAELRMKQWQAERIVRTEQSLAVHRQQLEDMKATFAGEEDEWRKMLEATFDRRTGKDSRFVHHQVRRFDEPFKDNEGRKYQHPPNRPNDREVMVVVPHEATVSR